MNEGVRIADVQQEFGVAMVEPALKVVAKLVEEGLLVSDGKTVRLTAQGRLLSNNVFQEFLGLEMEAANKKENYAQFTSRVSHL